MNLRHLCAVILSLGLATPLAFAHHGFASVFDANTVLTLKGNVTKVDWRNPHPYVYLDVVSEKGAAESWSVEFSDLNKLNRVGLSKESIKVDDLITVSAFASKPGGLFDYLKSDSPPSATHAAANHFARATEIVLSTGKRIAVP